EILEIATDFTVGWEKVPPLEADDRRKILTQEELNEGLHRCTTGNHSLAQEVLQRLPTEFSPPYLGSFPHEAHKDIIQDQQKLFVLVCADHFSKFIDAHSLRVNALVVQQTIYAQEEYGGPKCLLK